MSADGVVLTEDNKLNLSDSAEFMDNFENLLSWFIESVDALQEVELSLRQKSQIAGMIMGVANQFIRLNEKLKEWGYTQ